MCGRCIDAVDAARRSFSKLALVYFLLNFMYTVPMISVQFQWITKYAMRVDTFSYLKGFIFIPWALKPLFAFIPKHRAIITASIGLFLLGVSMLIPMGVGVLVASLFIFEMFIVTIDVHVDGWMIESLTEADHGELQSNTQIFKTLGRMCGSLAGAGIYHFIHDRLAFVVASLCACAILAIYTSSSTPAESDLVEIDLDILKSEPAPLPPEEVATKRAERIRHIRFAIFVVLLFMQPSVASAVIYYMQKTLHVSDVQFGLLSVIGGASAVGAQCLYSVALRRIPPKTSISFGISLATALSFSFIMCMRSNLPVFPVLVVQSLIGCVLDVMINMPATVRAAKITKQYARPVVMYAIVTSVMNLCAITSMELGAFLTHFIAPLKVSLSALTILLFVEESFAFIPLCGIFLFD